jgi:hypothetical protein
MPLCAAIIADSRPFALSKTREPAYWSDLAADGLHSKTMPLRTGKGFLPYVCSLSFLSESQAFAVCAILTKNYLLYAYSEKNKKNIMTIKNVSGCKPPLIDG